MDSLTADEIRANVRKAWNLDGALPVPAIPFSCPVCGAHAVFVREWRIGHRNPAALRRGHETDHRLKYRADVSIKCHECSAVWSHGVPIDIEDARRFGWEGRSVTYSWRDGWRRLGAQ